MSEESDAALLARENTFEPGTARHKLFKRKRADAAERQAERAAAAQAEAAEPEEDEGFFSSFFGRDETVDAAVEAAEQGKRRENQSTDSNN